MSDGQPSDPLLTDPFLRDAPTVEGFKVLDPAVLYAQIGRGGMGAVYRGRHCKLDLDVAVKCLLPSLVAEDPDYVRRFEREARLAASLTHQNVVRVMDVQSHEGLHYLVMEYVRGETAARRVERKGALPEAEALTLMLGATAGLAEAHRRGIVHRDIKPDNVLVSIEGRVKLADLGLARASRDADGRSVHSTLSGVMGTPQYMPPEQWDSSDVGPTADVWALGATLWYLLAGRHAIEGSSALQVARSIQDKEFPKLREVRGDLRPEIYELIDCCVARDPADRFRDAADLLEHLRGLARDDESLLVDAGAEAELSREGVVTPPPRETLLRIRAQLATGVEAVRERADVERAPRAQRPSVRRSVPRARRRAPSPNRFVWAATAVCLLACGYLIYLTTTERSRSATSNEDSTQQAGRRGDVEDSSKPASPVDPPQRDESGGAVVPEAKVEEAAHSDGRKHRAVLETDAAFEGFGEAIDAGLAWLVQHQDVDGRWDCDDFMKHDPEDDRCDGAGNATHDVGVTGLVLLALMGDGHLLDGGKYSNAVTRGLEWLRRQQIKNGLIGTNASHDFIYDHAIATLALCECLGVEGGDRYRDVAKRAISYLESHRNPYSVWRYQPRDNDNDLTVTGWCSLAYVSARKHGLKVNEGAIELIETFLDQVSDHAGRHGYTKQGEQSSRKLGGHDKRFPIDETEALTAVGLHCRFALGQDSRRKPVMLQSARVLLSKPPVTDPESYDIYYWYHATKALFHFGGGFARSWCLDLKQAVIPWQREEGSAAGSWDPKSCWGEDGGRIYATAMLVMALEVPCRHPL